MYFVLYLSTDVNAIILSTPGVDHTPETMISKLPSRKAPITIAYSASGFGGLSSGLSLFWIHCRLGELGRE